MAHAALPTLKLTISYDGAGFAGSQTQLGQRTVQEELERALGQLFGRSAPSTFAGRTDRGVHAVGQVVGVVDQRPEWDCPTLIRALNALLPDDIAISQAQRIIGPFHVRFDARWREYRYRIWAGLPAPLMRSHAWQIERRPKLEQMCEACRSLVGEHDFAAFAGDGEGVPWSERQQAPRGTVRRVFAASIRDIDPWWDIPAGDGLLIEFRIVADAFLPRMVRNIVGTLVEIGRDRRDPHWIDELLVLRDRRRAGMTAPPHGLILWRVGYGDDAPPIT